MDKVWLKSYQAGVPAEIDVTQYESLVAIFQQTCKNHRNLPAYANLGTEITYGQLDALSLAFGAYLREQLGLKAGDRIALMMPNLLQYPVAIFGALRAGLVVVNVNPLYTSVELAHLLNDSGAETILILANFAHVLEQTLPQVKLKHIIVTEIGDLFPWPKSTLVNYVVKHVKKMVPAWSIPSAIKFKEVITTGKKSILPSTKISLDDLAFLQYTGGTTGVSKGTMLTHRNLIANVLQLKAWVQPVLSGKNDEIIVTALPLYHIFSLTVNCLTFTMLGGLNVLITNPRDIPHFIKEIKKLKFTAISGVNTLFNALLNNPEFTEIDFSRLNISIAGGMALHASVAERWQKTTGCPLIEGYGLTEASPVVTANPLDIDAYTGSIGLPLPSTDVCVIDEEGQQVGFNMIGELCTRGPQVMKGYWNNEAETKNVITEDGWLKTGDIAKINESGYIFIVDRKKDMIIVSGFNVYPNEVESVIASHPGVAEVAVIGVPDEHSGEVVKAFVVKKDENLTEDDILNYCHQFLTRYKVPKRVEFRKELPKTNVGKILRRALRE